MLRPFRSLATSILFAVLALAPALARSAAAGPCETCVPVPDTCCEKAPAFFEIGAPSFSPNVLVTTREFDFYYPYSVVMYDLGSPPPFPLEDNDWTLMTRYTGPSGSWNMDSLGSVFGLTLDKFGNIYVLHTSCYQVDSVGKVFGGGGGAVYRIDGVNGTISVFCKLPNFPDPGHSANEALPGLGNITFDCRHNQFFVTDLEDGRIYRIHSNNPNNASPAVIDEAFDPLGADPDPPGPHPPSYVPISPGFAPLGERLWGVQWHMDRVFYSVWVEDWGVTTPGANEIRSVALTPAGAFNAGSDQHELFMPVYSNNPLPFSMPVSDISFSASGKMLLGERGIAFETTPQPHQARVLEYQCNAGCWQPANSYDVGQGSPDNSEGGVDYDRNPYTGGPVGRVWASGDHIHAYTPYTDIIYGYQGFRPTGGNILTSITLDSDGNVTTGDKTNPGDIEAPGCPDPTFGTICGEKYRDLNHNGIKDGADPPLAGWTLQLLGTSGTFTATTNGGGGYCFNVPPGTYTLSELGQSGFVQIGPAGGTYSVSVAAGQVLTGYDFGNYSCPVPSDGCVMPPPGMAAWWPFNEPTTSTTASDLTHLVPAKNVAQLFGGAAINTGGEVGNSLCVGGELDYVKVPNTNQLGTYFASAPFAIDAWIKMASGSGIPRLIVEKRLLISSFPYRTRGWALSLSGMQLILEIGNGLTTQINPGPSVPANVWTHIAVSADRSTGQGRWYLNGAPATSFNFTPLTGYVSTNTDIYMGAVSPPFGASASFDGCIDELEIFNAALPAASVQKIYLAGVAGKCPEYCRVPQTVTICKNQTSVQVCFSICNSTGAAQSYQWSLAGLPAASGCTVNGPTTFTPPMGSVTVPAGTCAPICVTVPRPIGLNVQNATSCYELTVINSATGRCFSCQGTIRADYSCWCITPVQTGIVSVGRVMPGTLGTPIVIGIGRPCDTPALLDYRITAEFGPSDHGDPKALSLNGLPPGEPVTGQLSYGPNEEGTLTVYASYPRGYDFAAPYEIVLEADTDGDGVLERICGTRVAAEYDSAANTAVPGADRLDDAVHLSAAPNPFSGGSTIGFALAQPSQVELGIYDLSGRLVQRLQRGRLAAGPHRFEWNGTDARGNEAAGGIYFVRLRSDRIHVETKIVKLE